MKFRTDFEKLHDNWFLNTSNSTLLLRTESNENQGWLVKNNDRFDFKSKNEINLEFIEKIKPTKIPYETIKEIYENLDKLCVKFLTSEFKNSDNPNKIEKNGRY